MKQQRRHPGNDNAIGQRNTPTVFKVASENTYPDLVKFLPDLFVFLRPEFDQFLGVARVDTYSPT